MAAESAGAGAPAGRGPDSRRAPRVRAAPHDRHARRGWRGQGNGSQVVTVTGAEASDAVLLYVAAGAGRYGRERQRSAAKLTAAIPQLR